MSGFNKIIATLLILASLGALWLCVSLSLEIQNHNRQELYSEQLKILATQMRTLMASSSTVELKTLLDLVVAENSEIDFCFIVSGGRPFLHTFEEGFPESFPVIEDGLTEEALVTDVNVADKGDYKVMSMLLGFGSSSIHIGIKKTALAQEFWSYSALPFAVPLLVIALATAIFVLSLLGRSSGGVIKTARKSRTYEKNISINSDELSASAPCGLLLIDPETMAIRFANSYVGALYKSSVSSMIGMNLEELLYASEDITLENAYTTKSAGFRGSLFTSDGGKVPIFINTSVMRVKREELIVLSMVDLSSQRELEERYKKAYAQQESLANHDKLTSLFNRRALTKHAEAELNRAERGEHLSIIILDIDHFKQVNDNYGHNVGDIVLQAVARNLQQTVRPYDWLGRWGGEEFIIILPGTGLKTATVVAERIRKKVEGNAVRLKGHEPVQVTVSFGVVSTTDVSGNSFIFDKLVDQADKALYNSKTSGRNLVSVFIDNECRIASFNKPSSSEEN